MRNKEISVHKKVYQQLNKRPTAMEGLASEKLMSSSLMKKKSASQENTFGTAVYNGIGTGTNMVGVGGATISSLAEGALAGKIINATNAIEPMAKTPFAPLSKALGKTKGLANLAMEGSAIGKNLSRVGNVTGGLGVGMGLYNFATAKNTGERVQAGADTLASGAGFLGPIGGAFSGGYAAGQLIDQGVGAWTGKKLSERTGFLDWAIGEKNGLAMANAWDGIFGDTEKEGKPRKLNEEMTKKDKSQKLGEEMIFTEEEVAEINEKPKDKKETFSHRNASSVTLSYGNNAVPLNSKATYLLQSILASVGMREVEVTSTLRTYHDQARINYNQTSAYNMKKWYGSQYYNKKLEYKAAGKSTDDFSEYIESRDKKRGKVISNHIPGYSLDVASLNNNFRKKCKELKPISGSGLKHYIPETKCTHIDFTFKVT